MAFKKKFQTALLAGCTLLIFGCETSQDLFDFGEEEEIKTVVQTQWSKEDQVTIFDRLGMQVDKLNLEEYEFNNPFASDSEEVQDEQPDMAVLELEPLPVDSKREDSKDNQAGKENFLASAQKGKEVKSIPATSPPKVKAGKRGTTKKVEPPFIEPTPHYTVQVGAFQKKNNSLTLVERLKQRGYLSKMKPVKDYRSKSWYTVRIGNSKNVNQAIKTAQIFAKKEGRKAVILKNGLIYQVISPKQGVVSKNFFAGKEKPIQPKANVNKSAKTSYAFHVGGLFLKPAARTLAKELRRRGYKPDLKRVQDLHRQSWWYQVEIGYYHTKEEAGNAAIRFAEQELMPTTAP